MQSVSYFHLCIYRSIKMTEIKIKDECSDVKKNPHLLLILILMFLIVAEFVMLTNLSVYFCQISF